MNISKVKDERFWRRWRVSGAVASVKKQLLVSTSEHFGVMAKKAFALAINESMPWVKPSYEAVSFTPGILFCRCTWNNGNDLSDGLEVDGYFYHGELQADNQGTVCIASIAERAGCSFPHSWHHLLNIDEGYDQMINGPVYSWDGITCPGCSFVGRVAKSYIGRGVDFGRLECHCYNCHNEFTPDLHGGNVPEDPDDDFFGELTDDEVLEYASDMNLKHIREDEAVLHHLEWYFKSYDTTPSGKTASAVEEMTMFQKISILEELDAQKSLERLPGGMRREISELLREIDKDGFRTHLDYGNAEA